MDARLPKTLIANVRICQPEGLQSGAVLFEKGGKILQIITETSMLRNIEADETIDGQGNLLLPGAIDAHVHFREPGLTLKADIASESRAAAAGGVTYVLDMPNVNPTTTTPEALAEKHRLFKEKCVVNYGIWYGITSDNIEQALQDYGQPNSPYYNDICGFKVFLGSSTGGMLMNDANKLRQLFDNTQRIIGIHSESEDIIRCNREKFLLAEQALTGNKNLNDLPISYHPKIRDVEACMQTTRMAVELAKETGAQLHVCHLTTAEELAYLANRSENISAEVCVAHLWFSQEDYARLGTRIKCNPAIKRMQDRDALRKGLKNGQIDTIATDHAPHLLSDKQGGSLKAASGMPSIQYSLLAMLEISKQGILSLEQVSQLMSANPAKRFGLEHRGSIAEGNYADLVLVSPSQTTTVDKCNILSKCGWSPFEGQTFSHRIVGTWVNGNKVY